MANSPSLQASLFEESGASDSVGRALAGWKPECWPVAPDWAPTLECFFKSEAGKGLAQFIMERLDAGAVVYPAQPLRALELTPLADVRVVILGQDPYHGPGQAEGLAFSVSPGVKVPPSLRNIFKELARERALAYPGAPAQPLPRNGSLVHWAEQGVLLINTCLTVEQGLPASHANRGWEMLTDAIVHAVLKNTKPVVFMLWGAHAQKIAPSVRAAAGRHAVLCANHPSPLSALRPPRPFVGCGHFGQANAILVKFGEPAVNW